MLLTKLQALITYDCHTPDTKRDVLDGVGQLCGKPTAVYAACHLVGLSWLLLRSRTTSPQQLLTFKDIQVNLTENIICALIDYLNTPRLGLCD